MAQTVLEPLKVAFCSDPPWPDQVTFVSKVCTVPGLLLGKWNPSEWFPLPLEAADLDALREACALTGPECQQSPPPPPPNAKVKWAGDTETLGKNLGYYYSPSCKLYL